MVRFGNCGVKEIAIHSLAAAIGILLVSGAACPARAAAPADRDPGGFRGLTWGASIEKASRIYKDLKFDHYVIPGSKEEDPLKVYKRSQEQPEIENVTFDAIEYWFKGGRFFKVVADLRSKAGPRTLATIAENAFEKVNARMRSRFGPPTDRKGEDVEDSLPVAKEATWILDRSFVTVRYEAGWGSNEDALILILQESKNR